MKKKTNKILVKYPKSELDELSRTCKDPLAFEIVEFRMKLFYNAYMKLEDNDIHQVDIDRQEIYNRRKKIDKLIKWINLDSNSRDERVKYIKQLEKQLDSLESYVLGYEPGKIKDYREGGK